VAKARPFFSSTLPSAADRMFAQTRSGPCRWRCSSTVTLAVRLRSDVERGEPVSGDHRPAARGDAHGVGPERIDLVRGARTDIDGVESAAACGDQRPEGSKRTLSVGPPWRVSPPS
jgi:hypothetical protein